MASPAHPLTPPADSQTQTQPSQPAQPARVDALLSEPLTSLSDDGTAKRPRDARLIHLLLAAYGVSAYQERVPMQLMDFAYRYTSSVLSDAVHIQSEGYDQDQPKRKKNEDGDVSIAALRMSIQSRLGYQLSSELPKEFLKGLADEKNRITLGPAVREESGPVVGGLRLPHERHVLTGMGWGVKEVWESDGEESVEEAETADVNMDEMDEMEDDEGGGRMEDVFGEDKEDAEMQI